MMAHKMLISGLRSETKNETDLPPLAITHQPPDVNNNITSTMNMTTVQFLVFLMKKGQCEYNDN